MQAILGGFNLIGGTSNVEVQKAGGAYRIHFQGTQMGGTAIPLLLTDPTLLTNGASATGDTLNVSDTGASANDAALLTSTSLTGLDMPAPNTTQQLVIDATSGTFTLEYCYPVVPAAPTATAGLGGSLHAGTHYYKLTAITPAGETLASAEVSAVAAENGSVALSWGGVGGATG